MLHEALPYFLIDLSIYPGKNLRGAHRFWQLKAISDRRVMGWLRVRSKVGLAHLSVAQL